MKTKIWVSVSDSMKQHDTSKKELSLITSNSYSPVLGYSMKSMWKELNKREKLYKLGWLICYSSWKGFCQTPKVCIVSRGKYTWSRNPLRDMVKQKVWLTPEVLQPQVSGSRGSACAKHGMCLPCSSTLCIGLWTYSEAGHWGEINFIFCI